MKPEEGEPGSVPMIRPPRLHLGREGTASRLELFFDLAYVLVIMQLAIAFVDDLSWAGLAQLTGLFIAIWFSWVGFTLYARSKNSSSRLAVPSRPRCSRGGRIIGTEPGSPSSGFIDRPS